MAKKVKANGKVFTFDDSATDAQIGQALDEYFAKNPTNTSSSPSAGEKKKEPSEMAGSLDYGKKPKGGSLDFGLPTKDEAQPEGSMGGEVNPIVSDLKKATTPSEAVKPAQPQEQDLRKVDNEMPTDVTGKPQEDFAKKSQKLDEGEVFRRMNNVARYNANSPKNSDHFDVRAIENGENNPNTADRIKAENDRVLYNNTLVQDYIDYLWNTGETDMANKIKGEYDEFKANKSSGLGYQSARYREIITDAQKWKNTAIVDELRIMDDKFGVKKFYKDNANIISDLSNIASQLDDPNITDAKKYALSAQKQALEGILSTNMETAGIDPSILNTYQDIAGKYADPFQSFKSATTIDLAEDEADWARGQEIKRQFIDETMASKGVGGFLKKSAVVAGTAGEAFADAVLSGILAIGQSPKVVGDMFGDTHYGWMDDIYYSIQGARNDISGNLADPYEGEDSPMYVSLPRLFGSAAGSMAVMMGGGAVGSMASKASAAQRVGTYSATMLMQMSDNYESALQEGFDPQEAALFATWSSALSAAVEQIVPEGAPPMSMKRLRDAIKEGVRGKELMQVVRDSASEYAMNMGKEVGEEWLEQSTSDLNKAAFGYDPENLFNPKDYKDAALGAIMIGGTMTALRSKKSRPYMIAEALYDISEINEDNLPTMTKESLKTQKEMHEIRMSLESVPSFGELSKEDKVLAFDAILRKRDLEAAQKEVGEVDGGQIAAEIEKVDGELKEILAPKAEAVIEPTTEAVNDAATEVAGETQTQVQDGEKKSEKSEVVRPKSEPIQENKENVPIQEPNQGGVVGEGGDGEPRPISKRTTTEIEAVVRKRDEQIGQILFGSDTTPRDTAQRGTSVGGDTTTQGVLEDRGQDESSGGEGNVDGQVNDGGDGENLGTLQGKIKEARQALEGKVNDLLAKAKSYNGLGKSARRSGVAEKKYKEIIKEAEALGLSYVNAGDGKIRITNKEGKAVAARGTARKIQEENEVVKRAAQSEVKDAYMTIALELLNGMKVSQRLFGQLTMLGEDSTEFKIAKRSGYISNKGVSDIGKFVSEKLNDQGRSFKEEDVLDALSSLLTITKGQLKSEIVARQLAREATTQSSEEQDKFDFEVSSIVDAAIAEVTTEGAGRKEAVENAIRKLARKNDLFDETQLERSAIDKFRNDELNREREANYVPYDIDETFSEGGQDAPFQESMDKSVEAINIFYDTYEKGDLGDAIEAAMDFIDTNPEARVGFEAHLRENRDTLVAGKKKAKKVIAVKSREDFKNAVKELVTQISDEDIERLAVVGDAMVKYAMKLDRDLSLSEAWEAVQGHITNDLSKLNGGLNQENGLDRFIGSNKLYSGSSIQDIETGEKVVVRVYHGTTNEFNEFDSSVKGNKEGHLGKVNYFTSDKNDASDNYQAEGKDLTIRIEYEKERIEQDLENKYGDFYKNKSQIAKDYGYTSNQLTALGGFSALAQDIATKKLKGGTEKTMDVFVKLNNPVVLGGSPQYFETISISDSDMDAAAAEIAEEYDISEDEAKDEYLFDVRSRAMENTGAELLHVEALADALSDNGYDSSMAAEILEYLAYEESVDLNDVEKRIRKHEMYENEDGELAQSQVIADFFQKLGFDGIILTNVSERFSNMGLSESTSHVHVFDAYNNQIKSATDNSGAFNEGTSNIYEQGVKGATSIDQGITAYTEAADVSTLIHEPAHNFLGLLEYMAANGNVRALKHIETINSFAASEEGRKFFDRSKAAGETWAQGEYNENDPTFRQELFARSAEKYFMEGNKSGFSKALTEAFESFAKFLKELYKGIKNSPELIELSDEMRSLFDAIYGKEAVDELNSLGNTKKLRNVIRAFVENSNLPAKDKKKLADDPKNIAEKFSFDDMEKLVDGLIEQFGIDAVTNEAMKEQSAIPIELKSVVYGRALIDLRTRIANSSGSVREDLDQRYMDVYHVAAQLAHAAGVYNAYFARIYKQDPRAVAKSVIRRFREQMNSTVDMERAEEAAGEVEKILEKEESISEVLEEIDILSSIDDLKQLQRSIKDTAKKIERLKKERKIVATAVTITEKGGKPLRPRAIAKTKAMEAARKVKDAFGKNITTNALIPGNAIAYGIEWGAWTLIDKAMGFAEFFEKGTKVFGKDGQSYLGEFYKGSVRQLRSEGYDVTGLDDDATVDQYMVFFDAEIRYEEQRLRALAEQKARNGFAGEITKDKPSEKKLKEFAQELKDTTGSSELFDIIDVFNEKQKQIKDEKDKAKKDKEYEKMRKEAAKAAEQKAGEIIKKALIDAGFEKKDFAGRPTGMVDWKSVVKDSKSVDSTVNKIMAVIPDASPAMRDMIKQKITDAIVEKKKKAIDNYIKSRQRADEMKSLGAVSRPTRMEKLMNLWKTGDIKRPEIMQIIAQDFGIKEWTVLDEQFIEDNQKKRAEAVAGERWIEVAELDEKMQAFMDARSNPNLSSDRLQSDYVQALLASGVTSIQNASNLGDTAVFSPIFDTLAAQVSRKGVGDKYITKVTKKAFAKALVVAFDQMWYGGIDVISAQAERTGNRESAPRVRYYEHSRKSTGQGGNRFIRFRNAIDDPRQKVIRIFPRLNAFVDAFGGVITQETKTYLSLREGFIDQGYTLREASQKAWDALNHDGFSAAFAQAVKEYPNESKTRQKRRAYEILEGSAFRENKEAFRRGQLAANIANLKSPELGIFSGLGYAITQLASAVSNRMKAWKDGVEGPKAKLAAEIVDSILGNLVRGATLFLKPGFYATENFLKYAAFASPALAAYSAIRISAMMAANLVAGKKEYDAHRISKDVGRAIFGYLVALALGWEDEEEEDKFVGVGPKDRMKYFSESERQAFKTWNGISFNLLGPLTMYAYAKSIKGNNERFREDRGIFDIVNLLTLNAYTEGIARSYKMIESDKPATEIIAEYAASRVGFAANPLSRTFNDIGGMFNYKQKPIGAKDVFLKTIGFTFMIDRPAVDAFGRKYHVGKQNAYSMDGLFMKHLYENAEKDKKVNDYLLKYNVPLTSLVDRGFTRYYDKTLATINDEELRYDVSAKAGEIRGQVYLNYVEKYPQGRVKAVSADRAGELDAFIFNLPDEKKNEIKIGNAVVLEEMNSVGVYDLKYMIVSDDMKDKAVKDAQFFGRSYLEQLQITMVEEKVGSDFEGLNGSLKRYARYVVAKQQNLELSEIMDWSDIEKDVKKLKEYGYVVEGDLVP